MVFDARMKIMICEAIVCKNYNSYNEERKLR